MTNTTGTITSHYQAQPTSFALGEWNTRTFPYYTDDAVRAQANEIVNALNRKADRLAPRFSEECGDSSCTNLRPAATTPRKRQVWDLHAEALTWNAICDNAELSRAAILGMINGSAVVVSRPDGAGVRVRVTVDGVATDYRDAVATTVDRYTAAGLSWATSGGKVWPSGSSYDAECSDCATGTPHRHAAPFTGWDTDTTPEGPAPRNPRHSHTDVEGNHYETYATSELRPGDVVLNSGMLILLVDHGPVAHHLPDVFAAHGYVLNPEDDTVRSLVGNLLHTWNDHYSCPAARWTVQGNDRATWQVLTAGPRLEALRTHAAIAHAKLERRCGSDPANAAHKLMLGNRSRELAFAAVALACGADPTHLPQGVLRHPEDTPSFSAVGFRMLNPSTTRYAHLG